MTFRSTISNLRHLLLLLAVAVALTGCGRDYSSRMSNVLAAVHAQQTEAALAEIDELIKRGEADKKPERNNLTLLLLERASIYQALGRHEEATQDLLAAEQMLEILDLTPQGARNAATYLFADNSRVYHAPIYEKLLVNVSTLSSFLALGDFRSAAVEARRIFVMAEYFEGAGLHEHPMLATAYTLAGLALEFSGDTAGAQHAYRRSLEIAPNNFTRDAMDGLRRRGRATEQEVIVIVLSGLGPTKVAEAFPVGVALGWLNDATPLGENETNVLGGLSAQELSSWVRFPVLIPHDNSADHWFLRGAGSATPLEKLGDINQFALEQWEAARPAIAWSAITRFLTRHVARQALTSSGNAVGGIGGAIMGLAGLAAQNAMLAADTPDTRAWNTIPAGVHVARIPAQVGPTEISVQSASGRGGATVRLTVEEGRTHVVTLRTFY